MTNNPLEQEFKSKLFALLREYNVTMEVVERSVDWATVVDGVNFYASPTWDKDGNVIAPGIDLTIGKYEDGKE